jgi:hypothetical protein
MLFRWFAVACAAAGFFALRGVAWGGSGDSQHAPRGAQVRVTGRIQGSVLIYHRGGEYFAEGGGRFQIQRGKSRALSERPRFRLNLLERLATVRTEVLPGETGEKTRGAIEISGLDRLHVLLDPEGAVTLSEELRVHDWHQLSAYDVWLKVYERSRIVPPAAASRFGGYIRAREDRSLAASRRSREQVPDSPLGPDARELDKSADQVHIPMTQTADMFTGAWIKGLTSRLLLKSSGLTVELSSGDRREDPATVRIAVPVPRGPRGVIVGAGGWLGGMTIVNESSEL